MFKSVLLPVVFLLYTACPLLAQVTQDVFINEVMASNDATIPDESGAFPDWIELYNPGTTPYVLVGHWITDDPAVPFKHQLVGTSAELTVPAQGFLLLWASGQTIQGPTHLGFSLSSSGESVQLRQADGSTVVDSMSYGQQTTDVSYGRDTDGGLPWVFFQTPTPSSTNNGGSGILGYLEPLGFSVLSGFYPAEFLLTVSSADPDVTIYYSMDGSTPGPDRVNGESFPYKNQYPEDPGSPFGPMLTDTMRSFIQSGSILISGTSADANRLSATSTTYHEEYPPPYMPTTLVRKATVIKARAFKDGYIPSPVATHTYFITPGGENPYVLPVISMSTDGSRLFDYDEGIYTAGADFDDWRTANPGSAVWDGVPANYRRETEFPLSMEIFGAQQTTRDHVLEAGFRMHGNWTLARPRKSLSMYFRGDYGSSTLDYPIFSGQQDTDYKRLLIRNGGNDEAHTNLRDISMQKMVEHMRFSTQDMRSTALFLNGEFWGVHHVRERLDRHYIERKYGIGELELDLLEINASVVEGTADHYNAMIDLVSNSDITQPAVYADVLTMMDADDLIDFYSACIYIGNTDWPHNNVKMFRKRNLDYIPDAPFPHDGRWRWMMYDTDFGFGYYTGRDASFDYLDWATSPSGNGFGSWATLLFRRLLLNSEFRNDFVNRHADMLNTAYRTEVTSGIIQANRDMLAPDMAEHFERWVARPGSYGVWDFNIAVLHDYAEERPGYARQELLDNFLLPGDHTLTVDVSHTDRGYVQVNTIDVLETTHGVDPDPYPWQGIYFETVPITLTAEAYPGAVFLYWEGNLSSTEPSITVDLTSAMSITAVFGEAEICPREVVHFWHFNDLPFMEFVEVPADVSAGTGALITYPGTGEGYMDPTVDQEGTDLNAQLGVIAGKGLRARDPSDVRELIIATPSTGYRNVVLSYAAMRTDNGAEQQTVAWTVDPAQQTWTTMPPSWLTTPEYTIRIFDLSGEETAWNNEHLAFRVRFSGNSAGGTGGNHRFDNITLTGQALPEVAGILCPGGEYTFNGITYDEPGNYLHVIGDPLDCGAVVVLNLELFETDTSVSVVGAELFASVLADGYQWVDCNAGFAPIPGADEQFFTPATGGVYAVIGNENGCSWMSGCHTVIFTNMGEIENDGVSILPNPVTIELIVRTNDRMIGSDYRLMDRTGRLIAGGRLTSTNTAVAMEHLASGIYFLQVNGPEKSNLIVVKQ